MNHYPTASAAGESPKGFRMVPAIVMMLLFLCFFGAILYVFVSSY